MLEHNALLGTVLENPDDDAPRLVYADWLEENGQAARAQLIRLQLAKAREQVAYDSPHDPEYRLREDELWSEYRRDNRWPPTPADGPMPGVVLSFPERGFIESVTFQSPLSFERFAPLVFARLPIREAVFQPVYCYRPARTRPPDWSQTSLGAALGSPMLGRLRRLVCDHVRLGDAGACPLAGSPHLGRLESLSLCGCGLSNTGMRVLARSPYLPWTLTLDLRLNPGRLSRSLRRLLGERFARVNV